MSRRSRTNAAAVSLFPFLDVLVCTMGSLILLLLVATNRIRTAAVERAKQAAIPHQVKSDESPAEPIISATEAEPEDDPTSEWKTRVEQMADERNELRKQISQLKNRLDSAQTNVMRTKVKAASTEDQLKTIRTQQEQTASERERLQTEIDALESDLTKAEQRLTKAVERKQSAKSKYAFLPFDGRSGTTKRPILIECNQDSVRFLPEDVKLNLGDLNGFTTGFNPVLMASRELVHFWTAFEKVYGSADNPQEPYVLLLVRPEGIRSFDLTKRMLTELKIPHGYELLDDNMQLELAPSNPQAKQVCEQAIAQSFSERTTVMSALRGGGLWQDELSGTGGIGGQQTGTGSLVDGSRLPNGKPQNGPVPFSAAQAAARRNAFDIGRGAKPLGADSSAEIFGQSDEPSSPLPKPGTGGSRTGSADLANSMTAGRRGGAGTGTPGSPGDDPPIDEPLPGSGSRQNASDGSRPFPFSNGRTASNRTDGVRVPSGQSEPPVARGRGAKNLDDADPYADPNASGRAGNGKQTAQVSGGTDGATGSASKSVDAKKKRTYSDAEMRKRMRKYALVQPGIGLEKTIPIRIWSDRILIGEAYEIRVDQQLRSDALTDRMLMAIDQVQGAWPTAGKGYHWVPTLRYEVVPGGEQLQQRLNAALFDLGMTAKVEYLPADPVGQVSNLPGSPPRSIPGSTPRQVKNLPHDGGGAR